MDVWYGDTCLWRGRSGDTPLTPQQVDSMIEAHKRWLKTIEVPRFIRIGAPNYPTTLVYDVVENSARQMTGPQVMLHQCMIRVPPEDQPALRERLQSAMRGEFCTLMERPCTA